MSSGPAGGAGPHPIILLTAAAAVALTVALLLLLDGDDPSPTVATQTSTSPSAAPSPPAHTQTTMPPASTTKRPARPAVSAARMIGQKIMVGFRNQPNPPPELLKAIRAGRVGGVILFAENNGGDSGFGSVVAQLQRAARQGNRPPLLIAVDQEGGDVNRVKSAPPVMSPRAMGQRGPSTSRRQGEATGDALRQRGFNVDLAPVADVATANSFLGERAFGAKPDIVARNAAAFAAGLQSQGVAATAKHYPGLGSTGNHNTDLEIVHVNLPKAQLTRQAQPFRALSQDGVDLVMVSNAIYDALDADEPAVLSPRVVQGLRSFFHGIVISDALEVPALRPYGSSVPVRASNAGVDVLLYAATDAGGAFDAMRRAHRNGRLSTSRLKASYTRIKRLKSKLAAAQG